VLTARIVVEDTRAAPIGSVARTIVSNAGPQAAHGAAGAGFALCATETSVTLAVAVLGEIDDARTAPVGPVAPTIVSGAKAEAIHGAAAAGLAVNATEARITLAVAEVPRRYNGGTVSAAVQSVACGSADIAPPQSSHGGSIPGLALRTTEAGIAHTVAG